jgi:putative ABC transport system permease protein
MADFVSPLAFGDSYQGAPLIGVSAALVNHLSDGVLAEGRVFTGRQEAVVGSAVAVPLGGEFTPSHGVHQGADDDHVDGHDATITVVGRMPPTGSPWDRAIAVPVELVWDVHGLHDEHDEDEEDAHEEHLDTIGGPYSADATPGVPAAVMKAGTVADAYRLRQAYNTDESMAFFPAEVLIQLYKTLGDMREIMTLMAFVTQGLVMLAIIASVLILFRLLMPQFVTLRAIGAPRLYIFAIAWGFVVVLFTAGVILGVGAGYALSFGISAWLEGQFGLLLRPSIGKSEILLGLGVWAMGLVLAMLPGWQLQRKPLAQAMQAY